MNKSTILVINDSDIQRESMVELLSLSGYQTLAAENGKKGLEILGKHKPDLILCDVNMPELDGYGVLRAIHNIPHMTNTPFIFWSSKPDIKGLRKGMNLGADDYLINPNDEDVLEVISIQLKKSLLIKQRFENETKRLTTLINDTSNFNHIFSSSPYKLNRTVKAKQAIYLEGDPVNFIFSLVKGKVKTFKMNDEGKEIIIGLHKEGDIFGHASFLENSQQEFCTAIEASELVYIPKEEFLQILDSNSDVALKLIKSVLCLYLEAGDKMLKLAYNSSTKKIADALSFYSHIYQKGQDDFPFDRGDIASLAGVAKESVSRRLSDFKAKGLIKIDRISGHIKIKDTAKFSNLKS